MRQLLDFSFENEFASMIPIMPIMSAILIFRSRKSIYEYLGCSPWLAGILLLIGTFLLIGAKSDFSIKAGGIVCLILGAFLISYGRASFKRAMFPLLMLLFSIPLPDILLQSSIVVLQKGSAVGSALLFKLTRTPYYRDGLAFILPGINIEIASQCSSIRSSLALLISSLLAAYLMLQTHWRRTLFVLLAVPIAMVKNSIRIVVLSLLAIHVDEKYLTQSSLHRDGGIIFFMFALGLLLPILWILRKTEKRASNSTHSTHPTK
jgi:exosortase